MALNHFETVCNAVITIFVDQKQHELSLTVLHVNTQKKEVFCISCNIPWLPVWAFKLSYCATFYKRYVLWSPMTSYFSSMVSIKATRLYVIPYIHNFHNISSINLGYLNITSIRTEYLRSIRQYKLDIIIKGHEETVFLGPVYYTIGKFACF